MPKNSARIFVAITVLFNFIFPISANAAYTVSPAFGQCFMHTRSDVSASSPQKNPISCSKMHNSETYHVGTWPSSTAPWNMSEKEALNLAVSVCNSDYALSNLTNDFNWWAWFVPSKTSWAKGNRWLRCDGMQVSNITAKKASDYKFKSWTGSRL
jgi:hypothetical protein